MPETDRSPLAAHGLADQIDGAISRLCDLHHKMLAAVQARKPYPVSIRLGDSDTQAVLDGALALEHAKAALRSSQPDTREGFAAGIEAAAQRLEDSAAMFIDTDCAQAQVLRAEAVCVRRLAHRAAKENTDG